MALAWRDRALWRHIVVEIVIVTAGILIAFSLDSWWEGRQDTAREQSHLRALVSDFEENAARLRKVADRDERVERAAAELLALMRENPNARRDVVWPLLSSVFSSAQYEPILGAYDTLVSTGDLTLIRDEELPAVDRPVRVNREVGQGRAVRRRHLPSIYS